jgi:hypothetical protein
MPARRFPPPWSIAIMAGSLIAAGGALFGAWLAFMGLQDQIGIARTNELETKRLAREKRIQAAGQNLDRMIAAHEFVNEIADRFPPEDTSSPEPTAFAFTLLDLRHRGLLKISANAKRAPDGNGDSVVTVINRLSTMADNLNEEIKGLAAEVKAAHLEKHEQDVIDQVKAVRDLARLLDQKLPGYRIRLEQAEESD